MYVQLNVNMNYSASHNYISKQFFNGKISFSDPGNTNNHHHRCQPLEDQIVHRDQQAGYYSSMKPATTENLNLGLLLLFHSPANHLLGNKQITWARKKFLILKLTNLDKELE